MIFATSVAFATTSQPVTLRLLGIIGGMRDPSARSRTREGSVTHSSMDDALRAAIESIIRDRLGTQNVVDVLVSRDEFEDDDVLIVTVVIDDIDADIDEDQVLGLVRHIQPLLLAEGDRAFPLISFSTDRERREAA